MLIVKLRRADAVEEQLTFEKPEIAIGRDVALNDIVLTDARVSKNHALIARTSRGLVLTDLESTNGTRVNGTTVNGVRAILPMDEIEIGDTLISIDPTTLTAPRSFVEDASPSRRIVPRREQDTVQVPVASAVEAQEIVARLAADRQREAFQERLTALVDLVVKTTNLEAFTKGTPPEPATIKKLQQTIDLHVKAMQLPEAEGQLLAEAVRREFVDMGPLGPLLEDQEVSMIQCIRYNQIELVRSGRRVVADVAFSNGAALHRAMVRVTKLTGKEWVKGELAVERRMPDGGRFSALVPPLSASLTLTIRKREPIARTMQQLVASKVLSEPMADMLGRCVRSKTNILVAGADERAITELVAALGTVTVNGARLAVVHSGAEARVENRRTVLFGLPWTSTDEDKVLRALGTLGLENTLLVTPKGSVAMACVVAITAGGEGFVVGLSRRSLSRGIAAIAGELVMTKPGIQAAAARRLVAHAFPLAVEVKSTSQGQPMVARIAELLPAADGAPRDLWLGSLGTEDKRPLFTMAAHPSLPELL